MDEDKLTRRCYLNKLTTEELSLYQAIQDIEKLGAHPLLTDTIVLIQQAREKLADYIDL